MRLLADDAKTTKISIETCVQAEKKEQDWKSFWSPAAGISKYEDGGCGFVLSYRRGRGFEQFRCSLSHSNKNIHANSQQFIPRWFDINTAFHDSLGYSILDCHFLATVVAVQRRILSISGVFNHFSFNFICYLHFCYFSGQILFLSKPDESCGKCHSKTCPFRFDIQLVTRFILGRVSSLGTRRTKI